MKKREKNILPILKIILKNKINKIKGLIPVLKNKKVVFSVLLTGNYQIKNLNKNLEIKIKLQMFYHSFLS